MHKINRRFCNSFLLFLLKLPREREKNLFAIFVYSSSFQLRYKSLFITNDFAFALKWCAHNTHTHTHTANEQMKMDVEVLVAWRTRPTTTTTKWIIHFVFCLLFGSSFILLRALAEKWKFIEQNDGYLDGFAFEWWRQRAARK